MATANQLRYFKVMGERNTGTNFLHQLIAGSTSGIEGLVHGSNDSVKKSTQGLPENLQYFARQRAIDILRKQEFSHNFGWKHARVDPAYLQQSPRFAETLFVFIVRNPFYFLSALFRRPYNLLPRAGDDKSRFLRSPILLNERDNICGTATLENPVRLWSIKTRSYVQTAAQIERALLIRYEDLVAQPDSILAMLAKKGAETAPNVQVPQQSTKGDNLTFGDYARKTAAYDYRSDHSASDIGFITEQLDAETLDQLGYRPD